MADPEDSSVQAPSRQPDDGERLGKQVIAASAVAILAACPTDPVRSVRYDASGTWTGSATTSGESLPIRFVIADDNGRLSGTIHIGEPGGATFFEAGKLTGSHAEGDARGDLEFGGNVSGSFEGDQFVGSLNFVPQEGLPASSAELRLTR